MDNQTIFLALIAAFVAISAIALTFQAAMLYGTYRASRELRDRIMPLAAKVETLVDTSRSAIDKASVQIVEITTKTNQILDIAKRQMETIEEVLDEASLRTRRQLERAEIVVDDALIRAQDTVALVHHGILAPIRGINGVAAGVRAALQFLMRGTRPSPDQVTVDEEMFI
jgi:CBS-domain-containing membrane protein